MVHEAEGVRAGLYRHYKGQLYQVLGLARHSETEELMVVYQALYGAYGFWVRPLALFAGEYAPGRRRFERLSEPGSFPESS